jgi:hypothetical protein
VEIGKEELAFSKESVFLGEGLFDLHDHVGSLENLGVAFDDFRSGLGVVVISEADACAGVGLDEDPVAVLDELVGRRWEEGDAVLLGFDFLGDADDHGGKYEPKANNRKPFLA